MTTLSERISQSAFDGSRLRVVLLLDVYDGAQQQFLEAYEHLRNQVASVPGHVSDQLCQSIENPSQWLITSEWESAPPFLAWVNSEEHVEMVQPLHSCVRDTRSLRFSILRETGPPGAPRRRRASGRAAGGAPARRRRGPPRPHLHRQAGQRGRRSPKILAGYTSPEAQVDDTTRLRRTSLFMHGNRVVRAVEVRGRPARGAAPRGPAARGAGGRGGHQPVPGAGPGPRATPTPRGSSSPGPRCPAVHHVAAGGTAPAGLQPARAVLPGQGGLRHGAGPAAGPAGRGGGGRPAQPGRCGSTIFQRDDIVVRLVDLTRRARRATPCLALGVSGPRARPRSWSRLLDGAAIGVDGSLNDGATRRFLAALPT